MAAASLIVGCAAEDFIQDDEWLDSALCRGSVPGKDYYTDDRSRSKE